MMNNYVNYEWFLKQDLSNYAGMWIAIIDKQIVANNKNINKIMEVVKKNYPNKRPLITKINNKLSIL